MKKYFFMKMLSTVEILKGNHRFRPGWGENVKKRGSKYEHFASGTLARGAMRLIFAKRVFQQKS